MTANSVDARSVLSAGGRDHEIYRRDVLGDDAAARPYSLKVLLENLLRKEDGDTCTVDDVRALVASQGDGAEREISFMPARVLMQDFTGVPAVVDLAAMRDGIEALGGDPSKVNPQIPADLVIDHSVTVEEYAHAGAFAVNAEVEFERNAESYQFLRWGQQAFDDFRVVPPDRKSTRLNSSPSC